MKDIVLITSQEKQHKGCVHMHTDRSPDSQFPYAEAAAEYRSKGFDYCVFTDHEVYWNSHELDRDDFIVLSGVERAFLPNDEYESVLSRKLQKHLHLNLIWDETAGPCGYEHDENIPRPLDWGISSWNREIRSCHEKNQLVILNHPGWSHMNYDEMLAVEGCFAFEIWNSGAVMDVGCTTDDAYWDYCLSRGKRILAVAGDDTHYYGPEYGICGACATIVMTNDFSHAGLLNALKAGKFYPTTGPRITEMSISDGKLHMKFSPASLVQICGGNRWGFSTYAKHDVPLTSLDWEIRKGLNYFRVRITDEAGGIAWSQPVFLEDLI